MDKFIEQLKELKCIIFEHKDKGLHFISDLHLQGTDIDYLPNNLTIDGSLDIRDTNVTKLPDNLTIGNCFLLVKCNITNYPII
jgi:hypothetical protein